MVNCVIVLKHYSNGAAQNKAYKLLKYFNNGTNAGQSQMAFIFLKHNENW